MDTYSIATIIAAITQIDPGLMAELSINFVGAGLGTLMLMALIISFWDESLGGWLDPRDPWFRLDQEEFYSLLDAEEGEERQQEKELE
jgi:hypothetical protein